MRFPLLPLPLLCLAVPSVQAAPSVLTVDPPPGSTVSVLTTVSVTFSEPVTGVNATDLGVDGELTDAVSGIGAGPYVFTFPQPPPGEVALAWDVDQGIAGIGTGEFVPAGGWTYTLTDTLPPGLGQVRTSVSGQEMPDVRPAPGATVSALTQAVVTFSEPVAGVDAADLLVNGVAATTVTGDAAGPYVFTFSQPAAGAVNFTWSAAHGIVDTAANAFPGTGWSLTRGTAGQVLITEFLAANGGTSVAPGADTDGTRDENWDFSPWIELHNPGATPVDLTGWMLTDDLENPAQWIFPARTLAAGGRLIVWASGKDRKPASGNLHTNFGLSPTGGTLALFPPDAPALTPASAWVDYPPQRYDFSYGTQPADGQARYFQPPSVTQGAYRPPSSDIGAPAATVPPEPTGAANGTSTLTGLTPEPTVSVSRGFFSAPFQVVLSCPDSTATIRYTLDGSPPLAASTAYTAPLSINDTTILRVAAFGTDKVPSLTVTHTYLFPDNVVNQPSPPYDNPARTTDNTNPAPPAPGGSPLPIAWGTNSTFTTAQTLSGFPTGTATGANNLSAGQVPADYGMDPKVWADPNKYNDEGALDEAGGKTNLERIRTALRTLPALSLVIRSGDMFGAYPNGTTPSGTVDPLYPTASASIKRDMTKPCSLELMQADGTTVFVTEAGIDLHGNASREPFKNPKHGFTIRFKGRFGAGKLQAKLYPDSPVREWDKLVLRGDFGGSWLHQSGADALTVSNDSSQRPRGIRIREALCKDTFRDMGRAASHHRFCNLFINGVCWGNYELMEDEAQDFGASYFGGNKDEYDVVDQGKLKSGNWSAWSAMKSLLGWTGGTATTDRATPPSSTVYRSTFTNAQYENLRTYLDLPWFQDYMIHHLYFGHRDWATSAGDAAPYMKNVYFIRPPGGTFKVLPWDMENLMWHQDEDRVTGMTTFTSTPALLPPAAVHPRAASNAEYCQEFGDRAWRHLVRPGGALTPDVISARLDKWTGIVNADAICLESARWGDYRDKVHSYTSGTFTQVYTWNGAWYDGTGSGYADGVWTGGLTRFNSGRNATTLGNWTPSMTNSWIDEIRRLKTAYYPVRAGKVLAQFRTNGLYPYLNAPELQDAATSTALSDSTVAPDSLVKLAMPAATAGTSSLGDIWFTTDGSDPRPAYDLAGTPRAGAVKYSAPFAVNGPVLVRARALATLAGFPRKEAVRAASPGSNVSGTYTSTGGASGRGQITNALRTVDGVVLTEGDRILLKNQSSAAANGIWVVSTAGTGSSGIWDRAPDWDENGEVSGGTWVRVSEGTMNADSVWRVTNTAAITVGGSGGTSVTFAQFTPWSALMEITLNVGSPLAQVCITELNYNPRGTQGGSAAEFVEFFNRGALAVDMTSWSMDGIDFIFPAGFVLKPGDRVVIASNNNPVIFAAQYPGVVPLGYFSGSLDNGGERISLLDAQGRVVCSVAYDDAFPWPELADNGGYSLELVDPAGDLQAASNWRASTTLNGTPGTAGTAPAAPEITVSEFLARPAAGGPGFVELHNRGTAAADVSGWGLRIYQSGESFLPAGTVIPAGGYLAVAADLLPDRGFAYLADAANRVIDGVRYGPQAAGFSFSRTPGGDWMLSTPTPQAANTAAAPSPVASLRLNEWLANPRPGGDDWLEIYSQDATTPALLTGCTAEVNGEAFAITVPAAVGPRDVALLFCDPSSTRGDTLGLSLPASGATVRLLGPDGEVLDSITYGAQAEMVSGGRLPDGSATLASALVPSPGVLNSLATSPDGLHLSEVQVLNATGPAAPWARRPAWVELANTPATAARDLSGWQLQTIGSSSQRYPFPAGTTLAAGGYLRLWCDDTQPASTAPGSQMNTGFTLGPASVWGLELLSPDGFPVQTLTWGTQIADQSFGFTGTAWTLLATPTPGAGNAAAAALQPAASARLNEWYGGSGLGQGEFVEIYNPGAAPLDLGGLWLGDSPSDAGRRRWQIAPLTFVPPHSHLLLRTTGPTGHPARLPFGIAVGGEYLRLSADDAPGTLIDEQNFPAFSPLVSQGRLSDGTATVTTMNPTPGFPNEPAGGQLITEQPQSVVTSGGSAAAFQVTAPGATAWQWRRNGAAIPGATSDRYAVSPFASPANAGVYTVTVTGPDGTATSLPATLTVLNNFSTFAQVYGLPADMSLDSDGDGVSNGVEFLTGGNPLVPSLPAERALQAAPFAGTTPGGPVLGLDLALDPDAVYQALRGDLSPDLSTWQTRAPDATGTIPGGTRLQWQLPAGEPRYYLRLHLDP